MFDRNFVAVRRLDCYMAGQGRFEFDPVQGLFSYWIKVSLG